MFWAERALPKLVRAWCEEAIAGRSKESEGFDRSLQRVGRSGYRVNRPMKASRTRASSMGDRLKKDVSASSHVAAALDSLDISGASGLSFWGAFVFVEG